MALQTEAIVTDLSLDQRVRSSIQRLGYPQLTNIECESEGSTVSLRGTISSFYLKQAAQSIASKVPGVRRVINELEVHESPRQPR